MIDKTWIAMNAISTALCMPAAVVIFLCMFYYIASLFSFESAYKVREYGRKVLTCACALSLIFILFNVLSLK